MCRWDESIELPIKYSSLPADAVLTLTVVECVRPGMVAHVAGTAVSLFSKNGCVCARLFASFVPLVLGFGG